MGETSAFDGSAARVLSVVAGARGGERAGISVNLAVAMARTGRRVCVLDLSGAVHRALALAPAPGLADVAASCASAADALRPGPDGTTLLAFSQSATTSARVHDLALLAAVDALEDRFEVIVVDVPSGPVGVGAFFTRAASQVLIAATPDATGRRQAATLLRVLAVRSGRREILVLPFACDDAAAGTRVIETLGAVALRPPHVRLEAVGWLPAAAAKPLAGVQPGAPAWPALRRAAAAVLAHVPSPTGGLQFFFHSLVTHGRAA